MLSACNYHRIKEGSSGLAKDSNQKASVRPKQRNLDEVGAQNTWILCGVIEKWLSLKYT